MQINVSNGGIIVSGSALYQYVLCDPSKTYTAAVYLSDGTIICSSGVPIENSIGDYNTLWVYESNGNLTFRIGFDGTEHKYVWAALYEGAYTADTLPAYVPKGYETELAACHYYYQVIPEQTSCAFATTAQSGKYFASSINFSPMRITPTVSLKKDSSGYIGVVQGVSFVSASEFDFAYKLNGTLLPATTNANYAGKVMSFYGVELSADL